MRNKEIVYREAMIQMMAFFSYKEMSTVNNEMMKEKINADF